MSADDGWPRVRDDDDGPTQWLSMSGPSVDPDLLLLNVLKYDDDGAMTMTMSQVDGDAIMGGRM